MESLITNTISISVERRAFITSEREEREVTDQEYAARIYCLVFDVDDDEGDAYTQGILYAIKTLSHYEQTVLKSRFRDGMTWKQAGEMLCDGHSSRARYHTQKALLKLRHPSRLKHMSMARIVAERDEYKQRIIEMQKLYDPRMLSLFDADFPLRAAHVLTRMGIGTVEAVHNIDSYERLKNIRDLGKRATDELIAHMRHLGFSEWADKIELTKKEASYK